SAPSRQFSYSYHVDVPLPSPRFSLLMIRRPPSSTLFPDTTLFRSEPGDLALADLRAARFFDGVIFTWHRDRSADGLAAVLDHAQRLGRLGGWEEDLVTGVVRWTDAAVALFGLTPPPAPAVPLPPLPPPPMPPHQPPP